MHAVYARILDVVAASDVHRHRGVMRRDLLTDGGIDRAERIAQSELRSDVRLDVPEILRRDEVPLQDRRRPDLEYALVKMKRPRDEYPLPHCPSMARPEQKLADGRRPVGIKRHDLLDVCSGCDLQRHAHPVEMKRPRSQTRRSG